MRRSIVNARKAVDQRLNGCTNVVLARPSMSDAPLHFAARRVAGSRPSVS